MDEVEQFFADMYPNNIVARSHLCELWRRFGMLALLAFTECTFKGMTTTVMATLGDPGTSRTNEGRNRANAHTATEHLRCQEWLAAFSAVEQAVAAQQSGPRPLFA